MSTEPTKRQRQALKLNAGPRISREKITVGIMIAKYCKGHRHLEGGLLKAEVEGEGICRECGELLTYAWKRLEHCRFGEKKTTCERCPVHCYKPDRRNEIKTVMRYAGPRMIWSHPLTTLRHLLDGLTSRPF
ncbi:nitrous oxide-stimulated promoter family protein [Paenibacillus sp. GCM10012306]|uniref:nitrous oxide-stimulated promoter family protein n=1 Tax=Paenibacillus sp. GCM10012306 TaxID=3317342 RepID=UPI003607573E